MKVRFTLNGKRVGAEGNPTDRLLDVVRREFSLTGTKEGCGEGECGACTVLLDGEPVLSCLTPLMQVDGREVVTVEALAQSTKGRAYLERFVQEGGAQCGACTPGIVLTAAQLLETSGSNSRETIAQALAGNICRCTGYEAILRALQEEPEAVLRPFDSAAGEKS
jgi:aerobic-type carbon monoxide dehydrogenase small subunit (CoxS/CutS family)